MYNGRNSGRKLSTIESLTITAVVLGFFFGIIALCMPDEATCIKSGCDRKQEADSSYCYLHKTSSYRGGSTGSRSNYQSGSSNSGSSGSGSTSNRESATCHHGSCKKNAISGSLYCASHTCGKGRNGCYREVIGANELCSSCKEKKKNQSSNSTSSNRSKSYGSSSYSSNKKSSSTKKYRMPDCDDYESYDDFMDDWDGNMPDGSDAEDYWEDW